MICFALIHCFLRVALMTSFLFQYFVTNYECSFWQVVLLLEVIELAIHINCLVFIKLSCLTIFLMDAYLEPVLPLQQLCFCLKREDLQLKFFTMLPLIFSLLSFNIVTLYVLPFSVNFPLILETPFTSFSSAWSLFDQAWPPDGSLILSESVNQHQ